MIGYGRLPLLAFLVWPAASIEAAARSDTASAGAGSAAEGFIPASYRGRWAPGAGACRAQGPRSKAVVVTATGWTSFEEGSRVSAPGKVVRGTLYHEVSSFVSDGASRRGTLALRLAGNRLFMSETVAGRSVHRHLTRCR